MDSTYNILAGIKVHSTAPVTKRTKESLEYVQYAEQEITRSYMERYKEIEANWINALDLTEVTKVLDHIQKVLLDKGMQLPVLGEGLTVDIIKENILPDLYRIVTTLSGLTGLLLPIHALTKKTQKVVQATHRLLVPTGTGDETEALWYLFADTGLYQVIDRTETMQNLITSKREDAWKAYEIASRMLTGLQPQFSGGLTRYLPDNADRMGN